jgi:hypothetical protein
MGAPIMWGGSSAGIVNSQLALDSSRLRNPSHPISSKLMYGACVHGPPATPKDYTMVRRRQR